MKIWITKHVLKTGEIVETEVSSVSNGIVKVEDTPFETEYLYAYKREWHASYEAAKQHAEYMREAEIHTLEKTIAKLKDIKFETVQRRSNAYQACEEKLRKLREMQFTVEPTTA